MQDRWVIVKSFDKTWSTGGRNYNPCKMQKYMTPRVNSQGQKEEVKMLRKGKDEHFVKSTHINL